MVGTLVSIYRDPIFCVSDSPVEVVRVGLKDVGSFPSFPRLIYPFINPVVFCRLAPGKMSSLGPAFADSFRRETWALYAVGTMGACLRL